MIAAWLLTGLAIVGIVLGAMLGRSRSLSLHLAAAGGGLLAGISLFWLMPEIAETSGVFPAIAAPLSVAAMLWAADRYLLSHGEQPSALHFLRHGMVAPLMAATALHSALDGWSIRALEIQPMATVAVLVGLALHKLPEGLALGWVTRNSLHSTTRAIACCSAVELVTVLGAWAEPKVANSGVSFLGTKAAVVVLMLVAGSFLFLGSHVVIADSRRSGIVPVFLAAFLFAGVLALVRHTGP